MSAADFLRRSYVRLTRPSRWWLSGAAICALSVHAPRAQAEVLRPGLQLVWLAPEGCPSQKQVTQDALRLVGSQQSTAGLSVTATVARLDPQHWQLTLTTNEGVRRVSAPNCQELAHATALYIALLLSPDVEQSEQSQQSEQSGQSEQSEQPAQSAAKGVNPQEAPPIPTDREPQPPTGSRIDGASAELGLGADFGTLPEADAWLQLGGGIDVGNARFLLRGGIGAARTYLVAEEIELSLFPLHANLGLCGVLARAGNWSFGGCLLAEVGVFRAKPVSLDGSEAHWTPWFSAVLGPRLVSQVTESLHLGMDVHAAIPLIRPGLRLKNFGHLHSPRAALRATVFAQFVLF